MPESLPEILRLLELVADGPNRFLGPQPADAEHLSRVFGGQVAAQALIAAGRTAPDRLPHSMHLYFLRLGDPRQPLRYAVTNLRDGRTFSARAVVVTQGDDRVVLEALVSLTEPLDGIDYQQRLPDVPAPESLPPLETELADYADQLGGFWVQPRAFEMRYVDPHPLKAADGEPPAELTARLWLRLRDPAPPDPLVRSGLLTYLSDWTVLDPVLYATRRPPVAGAIASLDHAMWFHRPPEFGDWLLYEQRSPSGIGRRGLANGAIYNRAGSLVCTVAQEGYLGRG
ncbi:thioesterase family protein [Mycobacterium sp. MYCO198283]|uniref:acyl-CoA thioesterase n=1 Tax=Mycobacterium sp. MYCO198283 TaxID=2883505 RepID=UPI001E4E2BD9|nr:acyl-CoA thioesterase domain-containing protein [Mycobacterium sp. MYCO198283]MCG5431744.1 thioesterase family protein [Mycobacterium sp. MYCO198283]